MYYHNTKYKFKLQDESPDDLAGAIIASSAMMRDQLQRRELAEHTYLRHRYFDPQLYLAALDPTRATTAVPILASYPWFGEPDIPPFETGKHKSLAAYKKSVSPALLDGWRRAPLSEQGDIEQAARAAVALQLDIECEGIILPAPLVDSVNRGFHDAAQWIDAGLKACAALRVTKPVFATVAICDTMLQNVPAANNPVLLAVTDHIAARAGLAGAYVVIETRDGDAYSFQGQDTPRGLLTLVDDLVRGAGRQVIVNYAGCFGVLCRAVGASVWSSGYNLSQRRLKSADFYRTKGGSQFPRYFSTSLAGDVGLEEDLDAIIEAGLFKQISTPTLAAKPLHDAIRRGTSPGRVPSWEYAKSRTTAAGAHYNECMRDLGATLESHDAQGRIDLVEHWLSKASALAKQLKNAGIEPSRATELEHQSIWLKLFREWRTLSGR
ncbi:MAG: hypothetical protein H0W68_00385 [Gemmatimonadaceae bacterium]|nr:hypothetical protein [Gemmatimonadaceae bacterium]